MRKDMAYKSKKQIFRVKNNFIHILVICIKKGFGNRRTPILSCLVKT